MSIGIPEILVCLLAIGLVLGVTRKRPLLGMLLTLVIFIIPGILVSYSSMSRSPSVSVVYTDGGNTRVTTTTYDSRDQQVALAMSVVDTLDDEDCFDCPVDDCLECDDADDSFTKEEELRLVTENEMITMAEVSSEEDFDDDMLATQDRLVLGDKPDWIYNEFATVERTNNKDGLVKLVVQSGPFESREECDAELIWHMKDAVKEYGTSYVKSLGFGSSRWFNWEIPGEELYDAISREYDGFHEIGIAGTDPMPVKYVELELDRGFHERVIEKPHQQSIQLTRVAQSGVGSLGILGVIATALGVLRFGDASKLKRRHLISAVAVLGGSLLLGLLILVTLA